MPVEMYAPKWLEKYNVEVLPEAVRHRLTRMLKSIAISDEGFRVLSAEQIGIGLFPSSDTPIKQLRHIFAHTYALVKVIGQATDEQPGQLLSYDYVKQFPELSSVPTMERGELLPKLDEAVAELYSALQNSAVLTRKVQKPFNPQITVLEAVGDLSEHFYLHAQNMIDYYEKYDIPRSASMKAALG